MTPHTLKPEKRVDIRVSIFQFAVTFALLWLLSGFWQLQVQSPERYLKRAEENYTKSLRMPATRGRLLDREGRVLVGNTTRFNVLLSKLLYDSKNLPLIEQGLNISGEEILRKLEYSASNKEPQQRSVTLKEHLTHSEIAFVEAHRIELPELELSKSQKRLYPKEGLASHVVGYLGEISDTELEELKFIHHEPGSEIGKAGLERQYNSVLGGVDGVRVVVTDSLGKERQVFEHLTAKPGKDIQLTLDLDLQAVSELAMEDRTGAVIALDPRNGEVLALVSTPNYFPEQFVDGIPTHIWKELIDHPDKPFFNRAIQAQLAPGSIFKPVIALAAQEQGIVDSEFSVVCRGGANFYGRYFRCHRTAGHGRVTLYEALAQSCDVFFYELGSKLGIDQIEKYSRLVGLGVATGIDLPNEKQGLVPSTRWKIRFLREKWYPGETISVSIGQGALTVTPIQMAYAIGGLVTGGEWHRPHLIPWEVLGGLSEDFKPPQPKRISLDPTAVQEIVRGLWGVVNDGGTGTRAQLPGYEICGKTGTAQVVSRRLQLKSTEIGHKDNAWFVGFAPCQQPEIVVVSLLEHGEHGHLAAPIVRDVIKTYFDKQDRQPLSNTGLLATYVTNSTEIHREVRQP